ncbi:9935_t:CDS:2 [Funneliformis caledonium]|uniref:9935_t:CDS:1 n=1 Tax=Funneliformis caledonium TaxID=1117310 RepID=A0A9N9CE02_9GLOM|nr:9935_t:CDS:2 [Funneliformis caledonium]
MDDNTQDSVAASVENCSSSKSGGVSVSIRRSFSNLTLDKSVSKSNNNNNSLESSSVTSLSLSKQKSATFSTKKLKLRPKSALPPRKSSNTLQSASLISSTAGDLIPRSNPPLGRPPSTPTLHSTTEEDNSLDITTFLAAPRLTQRVRLKTGRVVSFSEVGDRNGFPVLVFLGMGCVRYFIAFFDDLASSYGLRLICPDRPGVGLSDDVKVDEQQVLKWPDVIEELCEILSIDKFFIMAHSAGAPYALACAMKIPERLQGTIYLVCPWVSTTIANNFKWLRFVPTPIMKLTNTAGISLQQMLHGRQPYSTKPLHQRNSGALASPMSSLEKKQQLGIAILKASFAENLSGANNDLLMCFERRHSFGFSYTDINHPVHVFHGTKDERIPVSAVKWMEDNMPDCKLSLIEGGKHSLLLRAEIVDTIFKSIAVQLHVKDECRVCKISAKCWLMEEAENARKLKEEQERKSRQEEEERLRKQPIENIACT